MIVTRFENGIIVHSDGKSVWVNNPIHCVGRFSEIGFEIEPEKYVSGYDPVREPTNNSHWIAFVKAITETQGIIIPDSHRPEFLRETD